MMNEAKKIAVNEFDERLKEIDLINLRYKDTFKYRIAENNNLTYDIETGFLGCDDMKDIPEDIEFMKEQRPEMDWENLTVFAYYWEPATVTSDGEWMNIDDYEATEDIAQLTGKTVKTIYPIFDKKGTHALRIVFTDGMYIETKAEDKNKIDWYVTPF